MKGNEYQMRYIISKFWGYFFRILFLPNFFYFLYTYLRFLINPARNNFAKAGSVAFRTNGKSLDFAHFIGKFKYRKFKYKAEKDTSLLGLSDEDFVNARESLRKHGFWIAPNPIHTSKLEPYLDAAIKELYKSKGIESRHLKIDEIASGWNEDMVSLKPQWVAEQELTLDFATSYEVLRIASEYLEVLPVLNYPASWFSFPVKKIEKESAKNWHWDCDGIKWLKVFVYLNDVTYENGPHAFIANSHRNWKVNSKTSRITEQQVVKAYGNNAIQSFIAPRGTVIFEDTRGFHKGTPLLAGYRLALDVQFNFDNFGLVKSNIKLPATYNKRLQNHERILSFLSNNSD